MGKERGSVNNFLLYDDIGNHEEEENIVVTGKSFEIFTFFSKKWQSMILNLIKSFPSILLHDLPINLGCY